MTERRECPDAEANVVGMYVLSSRITICWSLGCLATCLALELDSGHVDPGLAEEDTGAEHESDVEDGVDQVHQHLANVSGGDR